MSAEEEINAIYNKLKETYTFTGKDIKTVKAEIPAEDYALYLCHKLQKWLDIDKINKTVTYYKEICSVVEEDNGVDLTTLPECCLIVITAAKYYVKGVYAVKRVYNL